MKGSNVLIKLRFGLEEIGIESDKVLSRRPVMQLSGQSALIQEVTKIRKKSFNFEDIAAGENDHEQKGFNLRGAGLIAKENWIGVVLRCRTFYV